MPNKPVHLATSVSTGLAFAYFTGPGENGFDRFLEIAGGALGGAVGGLLPDLCDPPCQPNHRSLAHGVLPVLAGASVWSQGLTGWQANLRNNADAFAQKRAASVDPLLAALYALTEMALRVLSGAVAGLGAGYLTHVALDCMTPCGLPLIN